jgi:hypothetical protein
VLAEYDPAGHNVQVVAVCAYLPVSHGEQDEAPATLIFPASHPLQALSAVAKFLVEYLPAAQLVQTDNPVAAVYVPVPHAVHPATFETYFVPLVQDVHPILEKVGIEAMHVLQALKPVVSEYCPSPEHNVQSPTSALE